MDHVTQPATILVVFGATGDLMARKIAPALLHLERQGLLSPRLRVIGFSRRDWSDTDFRSRVRDILAERYPSAESLDAFLERFSYRRGTFDDADAYQALGMDIAEVADEWGGCVDKLFYLAVPPEHYATILGGLADSGLTSVCNAETGFTRVLIEKPFGHDVDTSKALDELLATLFREEQVYRIDHYLAKEMLQGILDFRFHNDVLESTWNRDGIERIDISLLETIGVEQRGRFYDGVGALRDVGQNHLLQMLALVAMDQPRSLSAEDVRAARAAFLKTLRPMRPHEIAGSTYRAQHTGYRDIEGVAADSETETYFRLDTTMSGPRWAGVPVSFESGKRIAPGPLKRIVVTFHHRRPCLCDGDSHMRNRVVFTLEPGDTISISFWAKRPGLEHEVEERTFDFALYEKTAKIQYVGEYAKLLYDVIRGDQTSFVSTEEVRAMWRFIDPVLDAWCDGAVPLDTYTPDTLEPVARARAALARAGTDRQLGIAGLGKMGAGIARNLLDQGWSIVAWNRTTDVARAMEQEGLTAARSLRELVAALRPPRTVWVMVPAGDAVDAVLFGSDTEPGLADLMDAGDTIIDGGNSRFTDAGPRAARLLERGIGFLDCGTSGGPSGARHGACLMLGGDPEVFARAKAVFADVAVHNGCHLFGPVESGHFVKMVHNGIEYGMMQAIAEGFTLMRDTRSDLDLGAVADVYQHASVIESRLVGWLRDAYARYGDELTPVSGNVGHTGEGAWTVETARDAGIPVPVIEAALRFRIDSADDPSYTGKVLQALRNEFGGHGLGT